MLNDGGNRMREGRLVMCADIWFKPATTAQTGNRWRRGKWIHHSAQKLFRSQILSRRMPLPGDTDGDSPVANTSDKATLHSMSISEMRAELDAESARSWEAAGLLHEPLGIFRSATLVRKNASMASPIRLQRFDGADDASNDAAADIAMVLMAHALGGDGSPIAPQSRPSASEATPHYSDTTDPYAISDPIAAVAPGAGFHPDSPTASAVDTVNNSAAECVGCLHRSSRLDADSSNMAASSTANAEVIKTQRAAMASLMRYMDQKVLEGLPFGSIAGVMRMTYEKKVYRPAMLNKTRKSKLPRMSVRDWLRHIEEHETAPSYIVAKQLSDLRVKARFLEGELFARNAVGKMYIAEDINKMLEATQANILRRAMMLDDIRSGAGCYGAAGGPRILATGATNKRSKTRPQR